MESETKTPITREELIKRTFFPTWGTKETLIFHQDGSYDFKKPHHVLLAKDTKIFYFRGLGHTIATFETMEELDKLIEEHMPYYGK